MSILHVWSDLPKKYKVDKYRKWTAEEDRLLREVYPDMITREFCKLIDRTQSSVTARAAKKCIKKNTMASFWSAERDQYVRDNYKHGDTKEIAEYLGVTQSAVRFRANVLGITSNKFDSSRRWTNEENIYLKTNYTKSTPAEVAIKLNRTKGAVITQVRKLRLRGYMER